ncbi:hypothetical protein [Streptomyces monomycini]|uniref:hypothetical protein n=2 Tax=Streptomyces monomycini TaxID=371720 RepID=UPI0004AAE9B3|nr:hypothetical protein [Streptomyces monomycini]
MANLHEVGQATPEMTRALARYVSCVHVKDYRPANGGGRSFCPAGEGVVPYGEVPPLLHAAGSALPYALTVRLFPLGIHMKLIRIARHTPAKGSER